MIDFDFTLDQQKEIQRIAFQYKREAEKCYSAKAYLSGCILVGAAMEGLLLSTINCFPELVLETKTAPRKGGKIKHFEKWKLVELIAVAEELNWLPSTLSPEDEWDTANAKIGDYVKIVQQIRNLVHPVRYAKDFGRKRITKKYLEACFNILDAASERLYKIINSYLSMLTEERERRKERK